MKTNPGIDYGLGQTNIDQRNGIRYGVISQHSVGEYWFESSEADYGDPTCGVCGNPAVSMDVIEAETDEWEREPHEGDDYACETCKRVFGSESAYGEDPIGHTFEDSEYRLSSCLGSDIMILSSPYYAFAPFCSPCVPGAGNLDSAVEDGSDVDSGVKTYALGHEWFESGKAPYLIYRVSDNTLVSSDKEIA